MATRYGGADDWDDWANLSYGRWERNSRAVIASAHGQKTLHEFIAALDALPEKRLIAGHFALKAYAPDEHVEVCAIGAFCAFKGANVEAHADKDPDYSDHMLADTAYEAENKGMRYTMAWNIAYMNDETYARLTPGARWVAMRQWAVDALQAHA